MSQPEWFKLNTNMFENPKILRAIEYGGHQAVVLYIQGIAYSTQHLSNGYIPKPMPTRWGMRPRHVQALERAGLWYPTPIDPDDGWLIHQFHIHNTTKEKWDTAVEQRRKASRSRWDKPYDP